MAAYNSFDELYNDYANRYGEDWEKYGRQCLTEEDEKTWVDACYDLYPKEFKLRDTFETVYIYDEWVKNNGRPFEIVRPLDESDGWDLEALPAYKIKFIDNDEEFEAYPEEIFEKI